MALSNGLRYAVALLLFASAARLLQEVAQYNMDYASVQAGKFAVMQYDMQTESRYLFCSVAGATHRTNWDGSLEYFLTILAQSPEGTTALYAAEVTVSRYQGVVPILRSFRQYLNMPAGPCS